MSKHFANIVGEQKDPQVEGEVQSSQQTYKYFFVDKEGNVEEVNPKSKRLSKTKIRFMRRYLVARNFFFATLAGLLAQIGGLLIWDRINQKQEETENESTLIKKGNEIRKIENDLSFMKNHEMQVSKEHDINSLKLLEENKVLKEENKILRSQLLTLTAATKNLSLTEMKKEEAIVQNSMEVKNVVPQAKKYIPKSFDLSSNKKKEQTKNDTEGDEMERYYSAVTDHNSFREAHYDRIAKSYYESAKKKYMEAQRLEIKVADEGLAQLEKDYEKRFPAKMFNR